MNNRFITKRSLPPLGKNKYTVYKGVAVVSYKPLHKGHTALQIIRLRDVYVLMQNVVMGLSDVDKIQLHTEKPVK